jgi:hypothetical protein
MLDILLGWVGPRRVELATDAAYCNSTVTRDLPPWVVLLGAMRPDAVLTELPAPHVPGEKAGRPRKRGEGLPKPKHLAQDDKQRWKSCKATLYGRLITVHYKECCAQWYRACGMGLVRVVIVKLEQGSLGFRVFFSTDASMSVVQILEGYARRWAIEVCFKDLKQLLGFADSSARKQQAVERTAPFVGYIYTVLVLWFAQRAHTSPLATPPLRPWYSHKQGLCFADILRTAQRVLAPLDVLDPCALAEIPSLRREPETKLSLRCPKKGET